MNRYARERIMMTTLAAVVFAAGGCELNSGVTPARGRDRLSASRSAAVTNSRARKSMLRDVQLATVRDRLNWGADAMLCIAQPSDALRLPGVPSVVFTAIGPAANPRCNAVYDPRSDRMFRFVSPVRFDSSRGWLALDMADDARLSVEIIEHFIRDVRGVAHYTGLHDSSAFERPPSGWCSWYYYFQELNEAEVIKNARWMAENLKPYGADYIQIDDSWQGAGKGGGENRDWETTNARFPSGMKRLCEVIHEMGMKAGLWIAPHGQSDANFVRQNADAFLWRADGSSPGEDRDDPADIKKLNWVGRYIVDSSGAVGQAYLRRLFERLANDWGFDYFKIDGQPLVQKAYAEHRGRFDNPSMTPEQAYRAGLRVIRDAIGPQRYMLGGWGTPWWAAGILNGSRTGDDVWAAWEGMRPAMTSTWQRYWSHSLVWDADPDVICLRPPLSLEQARVWASVMGLTGQSLFVSDKMYTLSDDRVELLRRVLPPARIQPVHLYPVEQPDIICLKIDDAAGPRDIVGLFNWQESSREIALDLDTLGLPQGDYLVYDVWGNRLLGRLDQAMTMALTPTSCRVLCIRAIERGKPTLVGTSRHITLGAVDMLRYQCGGSRIKGESRLVAHEPYEIRFFVQPGGTTLGLIRPEADGARIAVTTDGPIATLTLTSDENRSVSWSAFYAVPGRADFTMVDVPQLTVMPVDDNMAVRLNWSESSHAAGYRVYRNGRTIGLTFDGQWLDRGAPPGEVATYEVALLDWRGSELKRSKPFSIVVPKAAGEASTELADDRQQEPRA